MRRLDIGICSYGTDPARLSKAIAAVRAFSTSDWRLFVIHNPSAGDERTREAICGAQARDARIVPVWMPENVGYVGAVNELFRLAESEYIAYMDFDAEVMTHGWDEILCGYLDRFHEIGLIFPNGGAYPVNQGQYQEILWAAGFCWVVSRMAQRKAGLMNTEIGHHEEVEWTGRIRRKGYKIASAPEVQVAHHETSTRSPESQERIAAGVVKWMNHELSYYCGENVTYHSENVLRVLDWNANALHMEKFFKSRLPGLNADPQVIEIDGAEWDLIMVPRPKGFYRNRVI